MDRSLRSRFIRRRAASRSCGGSYIGQIDARFRFLTVRQSAALAVALLAIEAVVSGIAPGVRHPQLLLGRWTPPGLPSQSHVLAVLIGLGLMALTPRLWRGTRLAVALAVGGLVALAALHAATSHLGEAAVELALAGLLVAGRGAFPLGCRNRPRLAVVVTVIGAWGLTYCVLRLAPLVPGHTPGLAGALHSSVTHALRLSAHPHLSEDWSSLIDVLAACAAATSVLAIRSLLRPAPATNAHAEHEYRAARAIVERYGDDSLSPFLLRPDKALYFAAGGVLSYRVIRGTAVVSSDPVAPDGAAPEVLASFLELARRRGWQVALWGAAGRHLDSYGALGLRAIRVGEEAFVNPQQFTLEGRPVRKLRQSTHRVSRRGWTLLVREGREIDGALEAEIDAFDDRWRQGKRHLHGFAMGMGVFEADVRVDDLYALARSPDGELGAVMRFLSYCGRLSLDTMRRVGETPNGLNEALVCQALVFARERGITELSLNYAGLAHLVREEAKPGRLGRLGTRLVMVPLGRRFQMERLVRFNEKFSPEWRPRYLVYESRAALPRAIWRVLQAEGYLRERRPAALPLGLPALPRAVPRRPQAKGAG